jgi:hypothetical protein
VRRLSECMAKFELGMRYGPGVGLSNDVLGIQGVMAGVLET